MSEQVVVTVKGIGDFSDVVNNVNGVQKALTKLKLPDKLGDSLNKNITAFYKEYEKYQQKIAGGLKTQGDYNQVEKSLNTMRSLYQAIGADAQKLLKLDMKDLLNLDTGEFKKISDDITNIIKQIGNVKIDTAPFTKAINDIRGVTKNSKISGEDGLLNKILGNINSGQIAEAKKALQELKNYADKVAPRQTASGDRMPGTLSVDKYNQLTSAIDTMNGAVARAEATMDPLIQKQNDLQKELEETKQKAASGIEKEFKGYNEASKDVERVTDSLKKMHQEEFSFNREAQNIDRQIQSYFGLSQMIRKVGDIARDAFATVKELDAAMTQTAVVTNFSVGDMWDMLPTYTAQANQLGSTIKDVYEAATLYYQQGLNTNQAMGLANETLKMARIAGLDAAEATNMMTAALRGFNMEINQASAQKINDIYSELAAITASDTKEIGSAMERTASIANAANMDFATTSAFLAQMIETTREAPENLGTAMKTIVARFQEMKQDPTKLVDSEGVAMDVNKVDKALKTIGVSLTNTKGEFRDLDDVFLDISAKWDSLSQGQQRYIATIAAGSRQQSRFIAMMSDYERTMELVDAANNSAGASQRQFEKTLDSMGAKLNMLKNAWDQFTMGLMNNQILKFGVDALTEGFTIVNKFIDILGKIPPKPFEGITKSILTLVTTLGMLNFGKKASRGLVMGGAAWWKGEEGGFIKNFSQGFKSGSVDAQSSGGKAGITWAQAVSKAINSSSGTIKGAMRDAFNMQKAGSPQAIETALRQTLQQASIASNGFNGWEAGDEYIEAVIDGVRNGQSTLRQAIEEVFNTAQVEIDTDEIIGQLEHVARAPIDPDKLSTGFEDLTKTASSAGDSIRDFGYALQGTPLEGFGNTLIRIGNLMDSTSRMAQTFGKNFSKAMEAAGQASGIGGKATSFLGNMFPNLSKIIGLLGKIPPQILVVMAILATAGAIALKMSHDQKKALESATDAAARASEAYDSAKQETSELADSIEQIRSNEDAFDGLVAGTAAFNEQLVATNQQITELLNKYPMLNDSKYLSTDKNGLMHINQEGLDAVKEYQKQKQANASALSLIQTADLNSEEASQKAQQMRKLKGSDTTESYNQRLKEADLVEQQAKAQADMAKINAVNTALVDKEIHNREKISAIIAEQYDARKRAVSLEGESIHDLKQEYADFYGYKYDKSTKKLTDVEGNEVDVDKETVKDAVKEIRVITSLEADGKSLDNMINHIDNAFSNSFGNTIEDSSHLFSDILSDNIDINDDLIKEVLQNPEKLQNAVNSLSEKEIAAVLGVSADAVEQAPDKYKNELTNKLTEKATNIAETQAQSYADLASMLAQATSTDINKIIDENGKATTNSQKANQQAIKEQLEKLTTEQKNTLSSIGTALSEGAGADTMRTFIKQASDIYIKGTEESIKSLDTIIQDVNWSSPTARLKAYNDMIQSSDSSVQKLGNSLRNSSESSNLLGEAFEEFYDSNDFQEIAENMDKFADSSGKLNASSIKDMANECGSLNNLLDTGAISAGGVAAALNAMGSSGSLTILDLNENLLKFLSTANQLEDTLAEAHQLIENFDWGVDTGESEDFAIDSTKKWKELYDNGEFGNQQLENYAKFVLGQERWNKELEESGGNIEVALDSMSKDILKYSDGFMDAWREMADSGEYQEGQVGVHRGKDNDIIWETAGKTTDELVQWLADTRGVTQEWAKLMVEDFANYSYDFKTELAENDFNAALRNGDYISSRQGAEGTVNVTQSEIQALAAAQNKTEEEITSAIAKSAGIEEDELNVLRNVDEKGNVLMGNGDIQSLNAQYSKAELGEDSAESWLSLYKALDSQGKAIDNSTDLKTAISGAIADGLPDQQATEMARVEAMQALEDGAQVFYDGVELHKEDLEDSQAFADKITEITENSRWTAVGEAIAQGYINYIKGIENPDTTSDSSTNDYYSKGGKEGQTSSLDFDIGTPTEDPKEQARQAAREKFLSWLHGLSEGTNTPTEDPKIAAGEKSRQHWSELWASIKNAFTSGTPTEDPKVEAGNKARENWSNIWTSVKNAFTSGTSVEDPKVEAGNKAREIWKGIWDKVRKALSTNPEVNPKTSGGGGKGGTTEVNSTGTTKVTFAGEVANPEELKTSLQTQIASILQSVTAQTQKLQTSVNVTVNYKKGEQAKAKKQTATVDYKKGKQDKAASQTATVDYTLGSQAAPQPKSTSVNYTLGSQADPKPKTVDISPNFVGNWTKTLTINHGAKGINNNISSSFLPQFGSAAKGRYGTVGPKNKGGLTLTGEEGFEIAWLPSESRSMILGANGPQLLNLPSDAVVYTHEQSKKIIKQKAIPAGSHAGRHDSSSGSNGGSTGNRSGSGGGGQDSDTIKQNADNAKNASKVIKDAGWVTVWWENMTRRIDATQRKIDNSSSKFDKQIKTFGTTVTSIQSTVKGYRTNLQHSIALNQSEVKQAKYELKQLTNPKSWYNRKEVSYEETNGDKKESKKMNVNLANYIRYNSKEGTYEIRQDKLDKVGLKGWKDGNGKWHGANKSLAEAIKQAAEKEINDRNSKVKTAEDNIKKAQEALEKVSNDVYETFYGWEKSINSVYLLSKKLEAITQKLSITNAKLDLQFNKIAAGATNAAGAQAKINEALAQQRNGLLNKANASKQNLSAAKSEFQNSLSLQPYLSNYLRNPDSTTARNDFIAAKKTLAFLDKVNLSGNNFNYTEALKYLNNAGMSKNEYEAIKSNLDKIFEKQNNYLQAQEAAQQSISEIYQTMEEYQSFIADFEADLLTGIEEEAENQIQHLEKLNSSLTKALKDLLDEVKNRLDQRRKQEDNKKTESDLSQKQQRLTMLRADTGGGHAVEIAQLEKELAEAQQNYQRTLEDQLLERLQQQGDIAEKQRQHQIDLLSIQNQIAKETGTNLAQVRKWMGNPKKYYEQIRAAWLENKNYDEVAPNEQKNLEEQFEQDFAKFRGYKEQLDKYDKMIGQLNTLENDVNRIATEISLDKPQHTAAEMKAKGYSAYSLKKVGYNVSSLVNAGYNKKQLKEAGITAKDLAKNKVSASAAKKSGFSVKDLMQAGYSAQSLLKAGYDPISVANAGYSGKQLKEAGITSYLSKKGITNINQAINKGISKSVASSIYGAKASLTDANLSGALTQKATGASLSTLQKIVNQNPNDKATQKDLVGVKTKIDINGQKKGGIAEGTVNTNGKWIYSNVGSTLYGQQLDTKTGKGTGRIYTVTIDKLAEKYFTNNKKEATEALVYGIQHRWGQVLNKNFKSLAKIAGIVGNQYDVDPNGNHWYASVGGDGLIYKNVANGVAKWDPATGKTWTETYNKAQFLKVAKRNNGASREYAQVLINKKAYTKEQLKKYGVKQFKTGGLADYTGPAWLDGTSSKPELILNAQDTKNFIALKDVLSKAVSSTDSVSNEYGGNATYEININVDHLNNDYDVDKVVERVKKKIVQDSGYRNVTQVRKFR